MSARDLALTALIKRARTFIQEDRDATFDSHQVAGTIREDDDADFAAAERVRDCDAWLAACAEALEMPR